MCVRVLGYTPGIVYCCVGQIFLTFTPSNYVIPHRCAAEIHVEVCVTSCHTSQHVLLHPREIRV
jgi:hypothetical protein